MVEKAKAEAAAAMVNRVIRLARDIRVTRAIRVIKRYDGMEKAKTGAATSLVNRTESETQ